MDFEVLDIDNLFVQGFSKYPMELEAAKAKGAKYVKPELIESGPREDEIIVWNYPRVSKY